MEGLMPPEPTCVRVLCNDCTERALAGKDFVLQAAWNPLFVPQEGDHTILACPRARELRDGWAAKTKALTCEGCGVTIFVAPSSQWLLDLKARLESSA